MSQQSWEVYTGATAPGNPTVPNIKDALKACQSMHSGATAPPYALQGMRWYDTTNKQIKLYDGNSWIMEALVDETGHLITLYSGGVALTGEITLPINDTTPSVSGARNFKTGNTSVTTILPDGATTGQRISIRITDTSTILSSAMTKMGMTIPCIIGDIWEGMWDGSNWKQTGGNVGMGVYVPVDPPEIIYSWIVATQTVFTDVSISGWGCRKGAVAALIGFNSMCSAGNEKQLRIRKDGSTAGSSAYVAHVASHAQYDQIIAPLGDDAIFEACFSLNNAMIANFAHMHGYWL